MKATVDAKNKSEKAAIENAMSDPQIRAFVIMCGILNQLPTKEARARCLLHVHSMIHDADQPLNKRPDLRTAADLAEDDDKDRRVQ